MADPVLIRYLPNIQGKRNFRAPSGRVYRFGGSIREKYVLAEDVDFFVNRREFGLVAAPPSPPEVTGTPRPPKDVAKPKTFSLTDVTGIGPASARKLKAAGITDIAGILGSTPEELAPILGFSFGRTRKIIANAMER